MEKIVVWIQENEEVNVEPDTVLICIKMEHSIIYD